MLSVVSLCSLCLACFVLLSVFMSRFCSSLSLSLFPPICSQTLTAISARRSTQRPKVCRHAYTHCLSLKHAHTHTLTPLHHASAPSVPSRSLQSMDEVQDVPPPPLLTAFRGFEALSSLTEKLWTWADFPMVDVQSSYHQDHRHRDNHWAPRASQEGR